MGTVWAATPGRRPWDVILGLRPLRDNPLTGTNRPTTYKAHQEGKYKIRST